VVVAGEKDVIVAVMGKSRVCDRVSWSCSWKERPWSCSWTWFMRRPHKPVAAFTSRKLAPRGTSTFREFSKRRN